MQNHEWSPNKASSHLVLCQECGQWGPRGQEPSDKGNVFLREYYQIMAFLSKKKLPTLSRVHQGQVTRAGTEVWRS